MEDISNNFLCQSACCEQTQMCVYCGRNQRGGKRAADILADLSNTDAEPGNCSWDKYKKQWVVYHGDVIPKHQKKAPTGRPPGGNTGNVS